MVGRKRKSTAVASPATPEAPASSSTRRRSNRVASTRITSKYFDTPEDPDSELSDYIGPRTRPPPKKRGRPSKKAKVESDDEDDEDADFKETETDQVSQENPSKEDEESDEDSDAPPKVTFIPAIKLRDTEGIPYVDSRIHPNTLAFLTDLKANNKRSWLKANDKEYRRALTDWETFTLHLSPLISQIDPTIPEELPFKDLNFRIYRDIRFSKDPTPYKPHFSAAFSRTGRKGPYACYYIHLEPNNHCFLAGGLWHPDASSLQKLRASIDERPGRWKKVLLDPKFRTTFLPTSNTKKKKKGGGEEEWKEVMKAFAEKNKENALKTRPKGFHPEHQNMELLKLKNFTVGKKLDDNVFTKENGMDEILKGIEAMVGFITHLNRIVMPDPGDEDDSDSDEDEDEDEDDDEDGE
ncbi:hypothetical protein QBC38DRAFT_470270 [Podospora fimiseda]|uniref:Uncharacterized protein n=1 Tax=Podospora fimiseda TaxID=252190 RepID=A0AAN7BV59_9PEZI|nr:hypothetical protein QBC38DRAFT_470270 [Podospora fimiseda]